jgi:hypothetical protein
MNTRYVIVFLFSIFVCLSTAPAIQAQVNAQERADALRLQIEDMKTKELDLQYQLEGLEEQLKPENIEKGLAGIGSTKPEDLRDLKRKQLEIEKNSVQKQLALIADGRARLETSLAEAEAEAYHQSAKVPPPNSGEGSASAQAFSENTSRRARRVNKTRMSRIHR